MGGDKSLGLFLVFPDTDLHPTPNSHLSNRGCSDCGDFGFNPGEPGILYYIALTTEEGDIRYKIGITNHSVEKRFPAPDLAGIRIVKTWRYAIGFAAVEREAEIRQVRIDERAGKRLEVSFRKATRMTIMFRRSGTLRLRGTTL